MWAKLWNWSVQNAMQWTVSVAVFLWAARFLTPAFMDMLIDAAALGLVWVAAYLSRQKV